MKKIQSVLVSAAIAMTAPAGVDAGINDSEVILYRFPGMTDNGGAVKPDIYLVNERAVNLVETVNSAGLASLRSARSRSGASCRSIRSTGHLNAAMKRRF